MSSKAFQSAPQYIKAPLVAVPRNLLGFLNLVLLILLLTCSLSEHGTDCDTYPEEALNLNFSSGILSQVGNTACGTVCVCDSVHGSSIERARGVLFPNP